MLQNTAYGFLLFWGVLVKYTETKLFAKADTAEKTKSKKRLAFCETEW